MCTTHDMGEEPVSDICTGSFIKLTILQAIKDVKPMCLVSH